MVMENRYEKYKDSGIAWIGEIPEHWEVKKIKNICSQTNIKENSKGNPLLYIGLENIESGSGKYVNTTSEVDGIANRFCKNNVLFGKLRPYLSKVYLAKSDGICSTEFIVYDTKENDCHFIHKLLLSQSFIDVVNSSTYGAKMPRANSEFINNIYIQIPPIQEQQHIATYLDQKCSEIDELIILQEEMITKLQSYKQSVITEAVTKGLDKNVPLKDSGIKWIGEIPEHWEASKTLFSLSMPITDGPHTTPELFETGIPFVSAEAVSFGDGRIDFSRIRGYISENFYQECCKKYVPQVDDIYMIKSGATTGRVAIVDTDVKFTIWSPLAVFRCNKERMLPRFLFYQLQSNGYQKQIELNWSYGTQQNIGMRTLEKLILSVPPLSEQQSIADYLDQKCSEIDELISIKQQKIEKLKDYKKSLIFECVTGKRKV
jgi:type I restriction enzyme S subunit